MLDQMAHNALSVIGSPTLVTGALTVDTDQASSYAGPTSYASAGDSASLSITGSLSVELFVQLAALPGGTRDIVRKTGSYAVQVDSSGHVLFNLVNGASNVTVTSNVTLSTGRWYHLACVYNNEYAGIQRFGKSTVGASSLTVENASGNNKGVSKFTLVEQAILNSVSLSLEYVDEIWPFQMCAVVYSDAAGVPDQLVTKSSVQILNQPIPQWRNWTWVTFPLTTAVVPAGDYHLGYVGDAVDGAPKQPLIVNCDSSGGTTSRSPDSVSGPSDPFGSGFLPSADMLAAYCDYSAVGRSGFEGKALIYIDGALNTSAAYAAGIADTANALEVCPALAAQVDEISIWNRPLTSVQVATHYTAH